VKILIIDNTMEPKSFGSPELCRIARQEGDSTVYVRRAPEGDLPDDPKAFDRVIVSGSITSCLSLDPWIDSLLAFIRKTINERVPYLGVCFGHQMLARALGERELLRKAKSPEFGWTKIKVTHQSPIFHQMPSEFHTFSSHYEEVATLPRSFTKLAESDQCAIQACQLEGYPAFGIQFHPEKTDQEGEEILKQKMKKGPDVPLLNIGKGSQLYDGRIAQTLMRNFLQNE